MKLAPSPTSPPNPLSSWERGRNKSIIFLIGGGTAGSVMPLLAVAEHLSDAQIYFIGTKYGVERKLVERKLPYLTIPAGKLRRYFAWQNFIDPIKVVIAFFKALYLVMRYRPKVVVSAGSFVATPMIWAAWCCGVPVVVHQQDVKISLTTRLTAPFATILTKAFSDIKLFGAEWIGNPVRDLTPTTRTFRTSPEGNRTFPTIFIFGGGTGAQALNNLVTKTLCDFANVIHVTGTGKNQNIFANPRYHHFELLNEEYKEALSKADIVVARAGLSTISELATLGKSAIIIPMPNSHQEYNAHFLQEHEAAIILDQAKLTPETFTQEIKNLLHDTQKQKYLSENIRKLIKANAAEVLAEKIRILCVK